MGLRNEHRRRPAPLLDEDLRLSTLDIVPDPAVGDVVHAMLGDEPVEDTFGGVPLLSWGVQVRAQDRIDDRFVGVNHRAAGWHRLAPCRPR